MQGEVGGCGGGGGGAEKLAPKLHMYKLTPRTWTNQHKPVYTVTPWVQMTVHVPASSPLTSIVYMADVPITR